MRTLLNRFCWLGLLTALLVVATPLRAAEKPPLTWFIWDLPPEFIKDGPWKNQGYADKFLKFFMDNLPGYQHGVQRVNVPRWGREVLKPNRCSAHLWGGFFPDKLLLSKPYSFTPPHRVIFHKRYQDRLGPPGTVLSLKDLLAQPDLILMTMRLNFNDEAKQSRYPVLYPYLAPYQGMTNLIERSGGQNAVNLELLGLNRADYTIGYPSTITTQRRINNLSDDYIAYRLKEHNLYKNVYVACLNDDFGRDVIKKVNALLTKETLMKFLSYHEEWNAQDPEFRRTTIEYFIEGKKLGNVIE